jgi:type VI secretion system protein ImpL
MSNKDQLKSAINLGGLISLYGIASLLVVALGPQFGFGWAEQIILIALILLTWPFAILIGHYRKRREARPAEDESPPASARPKRGGDTPARAYDDLTRGAEEVTQWLRSTKLGAAKSGDAVYRLPWFVVAGLPDSGKTALLLSSGLDYHTLPSQRRADQNLIRPTRRCEWRVTDWAVLLDTCGRYQSEGPDADEWLALVETLKKHRENRPLDGLLITAGLEKILDANEVEIEQQAKTLRARLDELIAQTRLKFPVYLVFTHADALEGFDEFFATLSASESAQVWGATIPLAEASRGHALFDVEFDYLYDALMRRRLIRLSEQETPAEQLYAFDFPLRFAEGRRKLGLFTSALFRPSPLKENPLMRGFYFTSSPAAGRPGARGASDDEAPGGADEVFEAGDGVFTEHLFKDVLLRDKDLATAFQAGRQSTNRWRNVWLGAAAALLLFVFLGLLVSFANNKALVADARIIGEQVDKNTQANRGKDLSPDDPAAAQQLAAIDRLREVLVALDERRQDWPPLYANSLFYRFGLYSGQPLDAYLRGIYFEAVHQRFFKPTMAALEGDLRAFAAADQPKAGEAAARPPAAADAPAPSAEDRLGLYYDRLKAYLMLSSRAEKAEPSFLVSQLKDYWKKSAAAESQDLALRQLDFYADQAQRDDAPHVKADDGLVSQARDRLESYPPYKRYYKRVTTEIAARVEAVTLEQIAKKGVLEGSARVSGSFTLAGYKQMLRAIDAAAKKMSEEDWVMGEGAARGKDQAADVSKLNAMYAQQYIDEWRNFLKEVRVKDFKGPEQAVAALKELSANSSPLVQVIKEVARQTNISGGGSSFLSKLNFFSGGKSESGVAAQIDKAFRPIIDFAEGKKDADSLSVYLKALTDVRDLLNTASGDQWAQASKTLLTANDPKGFQKSEQAVKALLEEMGKNEAGTDAANLLAQPFGNVRAIVVGDIREQIEKDWTEKLFKPASEIESGYPFKVTTREASLPDLAKFLNPVDGQLTVFFKEKLESSFDDAGGQWKPKEGKLKFSDSFVSYLNAARRLRDALFQTGGKQPAFDYTMTLQRAAGANTLVEIQADDKRVDTQNVSQRITWAGSSLAKVAVSSAEPRTYSGTWSLFKMFEDGHPSKAPDNQYALGWKVGSMTVQARLAPPSPANNPFDMKLFRELHAPPSTK